MVTEGMLSMPAWQWLRDVTHTSNRPLAGQ